MFLSLVHGCFSASCMVSHQILAGSRFLDTSESAEQRRAERQKKRRDRQNAKKRKRPAKHNVQKRGSTQTLKPVHGRNKERANRTGKRKRMPCCGKERRYCQCSEELEGMIDDSAVKRFIAHITQSDILTPRDPKDMSFIISKLDNARISIQNFMFRAALFRMYSKPSTYEALCEHVGAPQPDGLPPDFKGMEKALVKLYAAREPVWGGMFYPATLRAVTLRNGRVKLFTKATTPALKANRDIHVFKTIWSALAKDGTLQAYYSCRQALSHDSTSEPVVAARNAFASWYDSFYDHLKHHTKGWFGDYAMKCILDVGCNVTLHSIQDTCQVFPDEVLSKWPVNCPAYSAALKKLLTPSYKGATIKRSLKHKLLMHVHCVVAKKLGGNPPHGLSSTLAQLCWQKRQSNAHRPKDLKKRQK